MTSYPLSKDVKLLVTIVSAILCNWNYYCYQLNVIIALCIKCSKINNGSKAKIKILLVSTRDIMVSMMELWLNEELFVMREINCD